MRCFHTPGVSATVRCFRPLYGALSQTVFDSVVDREAATALWSIDSSDWTGLGWASIVNNVLGAVQDRRVVLLYDGGADRTETIIASAWIIQGLSDQGYQIVPIC